MGKNKKVLLEMVRAGLLGHTDNTDSTFFFDVDWGDVYRLAERQGVIGFIADAIDRFKIHVPEFKIPQEWALQFIAATLQIEQRNRAMNGFVAELTELMRMKDIYAVLVKGQGVGQCYEKPLWRPSGDVDLLLSEENYRKAKTLMLQMLSGSKHEERYSKHLGMNIGEWYVEIHGSLRTGLSAKVDRMVDSVQKSVFNGGNIRSWQNGKTQVFLPAPTEDVFLIFTHFIKHFYKEGMSLRQVCDWCRLMWTFRDALDEEKLKAWIRKSGLKGEWIAFATLAVEYLGMPKTAVPNFGSNLSARAERLVEFILSESHGKVKDTWQIAKIFPWHTVKFLPSIFLNVNRLKIKERFFS